jgi:NADH-quinone oxidoreductase subunit L
MIDACIPHLRTPQFLGAASSLDRRNLWLIPAMPMLAAGLIALLKQPQRKTSPHRWPSARSVLLAAASSCAFAHVLSAWGTAVSDVARSSTSTGFTSARAPAARLGARSARRRHAGDGHLRRPADLHLLHRLHGARRKLHALLLLPLALRRSHARRLIANSLLLLFMCWEIVGLTSYLLIGFWYHKPSAAAAAKKAFLTTRVGDIFFLLGIVWLFAQTGTLLFYNNGAGCDGASRALRTFSRASLRLGLTAAARIGLLIFCGAAGKSGQFRCMSGCPMRWKARRPSAR